MHRRLEVLLLVVLILALTTSACTGGEIVPTPEPTTKPPPTRVPPTEPVPTEVPPTEPQPTEVPPTEPRPTEITPTKPPLPTNTSEPVEPQPPMFFTEEFDVGGAPNWTYLTLGSTEDGANVYTENGNVVFEATEPYTMTMLFYEPYVYDDVRLDSLVKNRGSNDFYYGLAARFGEGGFYLFAINPGGLYGIWLIDFQAGNKMLRTGGSKSINVGKSENLLTAIIKGNELHLSINDVDIWTLEDDAFTEAGYIGIGILSFENLPIKVNFDYVAISEP